jgi:hypothetical protein
MKKYGTDFQNEIRLLLDKNGIAVCLWNWVGSHTLEVGYLTKTDYEKSYTLFDGMRDAGKLTLLPDCESTLFIEEGKRQVFFF